jgi:hypothetical protein
VVWSERATRTTVVDEDDQSVRSVVGQPGCHRKGGCTPTLASCAAPHCPMVVKETARSFHHIPVAEYRHRRGPFTQHATTSRAPERPIHRCRQDCGEPRRRTILGDWLNRPESPSDPGRFNNRYLPEAVRHSVRHSVRSDTIPASVPNRSTGHRNTHRPTTRDTPPISKVRCVKKIIFMRIELENLETVGGGASFSAPRCTPIVSAWTTHFST